MKKLVLHRIKHTHDVTLGTLTVGAHTLFTLELPDDFNQRSISCIPKGAYICKPHGWEPDTQYKYKRVWEVCDVPDRDAILLHVGNYIKDTDGCILVGTDLVSSKPMVSNSTKAINLLRDLIGEEKFILIID